MLQHWNPSFTAYRDGEFIRFSCVILAVAANPLGANRGSPSHAKSWLPQALPSHPRPTAAARFYRGAGPPRLLHGWFSGPGEEGQMWEGVLLLFCLLGSSLVGRRVLRRWNKDLCHGFFGKKRRSARAARKAGQQAAHSAAR